MDLDLNGFFEVCDMKNKEWNGEGVPPVGTECEYISHTDYNSSWVKVKVVFIGESLLVLERVANGHEFSSQIADVSFRPIKTPERISAEERENVIADMYEIVMRGDSIKLGVEALYYAGYRKTEYY